MTDSALEQIILKLLDDYPDKEIVAKHIVQLFRRYVSYPPNTGIE